MYLPCHAFHCALRHPNPPPFACSSSFSSIPLAFRRHHHLLRVVFPFFLTAQQSSPSLAAFRHPRLQPPHYVSFGRPVTKPFTFVWSFVSQFRMLKPGRGGRHWFTRFLGRD